MFIFGLQYLKQMSTSEPPKPRRQAADQPPTGVQYDDPQKDLNANMPQYITQVPWYVQKTNQPTLKHHHKFYEPQKLDINNWYDRGRKGQQAMFFRKGACENCGAMGHNKRECTERPRKFGAKFTNKNIAADDVQKEVVLDWEGKRDRWNGYDPDRHKELTVEFEEYESVKKKRKQEEIEKKAETGEEIAEDDEFRAADDPVRASNLPSKSDKIAKKYHGTINVREREDKAKYLLNLDLNSASFDPKSRSMNQNPNPLLPDEKQSFKGDNYMTDTGDKMDLIDQQRFALQQAQLRNSELNTVALPSLTAHVYKTVKKNNQIFNSGRTGELLKKYGINQAQLRRPQTVVQSEAYYEYTLDGKLKKDANRDGRIKSKYPEDVFTNDHTTVWGSWWNQHLGWGYACCHSNTKISVCMGHKGKEMALQREYKVKKQKIKEEVEAKQAAEKNAEEQQQQEASEAAEVQNTG